MVFMMLSPSELSSGDSALSSEEQGALDNYNQWFVSGDAHDYDAHDYKEEIEKALNTLLVFFPQHPVLLLRRAQHYLKQNKYDRARVDLTQLLEQVPFHVEALLKRIQIYHEANQDVELLRDLNCLLNLQPFLSDPDMLDDQIRMRAWRSQVYMKQQALGLALLDLAYIIEHVIPEQEQYRLFHYYYDALNARSEILKTQGKLEAELLDLNQLLAPPFFRSQKHLYREPYGNVHSYSRRGLYRRSEIYVAQENYDGALRDLDALLNEDEYDAPALMLRSQVDELIVRKKMLFKLEGAEENRAIPSLLTLAKMAFFRHEVNMDTSEWVAENPTGVRTLFKDAGITPEAICSMRELLYVEAPVEQTVFDDLAMHEIAADTNNKKRKHDAISPTMS